MLWLALAGLVVGLLAAGQVEAAAVAGILGLVLLGRRVIVESLRRPG